MGRKIAQKERSQGYMTLGEFIDPNRSILIRRNFGGAGDILMQRPIFDEIKRRNKLVQVHYTLPRKYIPLVQDLDSIDKIIPLEELGDIEERYNWKKDISTACIQHENTYGRNVFRQRTDIWADHLGIEVTEHGTLFQFTEKEIKEAREAIVRVAGTVDSLFFHKPPKYRF